MEQRFKSRRGVNGIGICLLVFIIAFSFRCIPVHAADQENCMLCHRYSGIAAFTPETGMKKIFYINEGIFRKTVHGAVQCTHCHADVKEVPHKPAKKVDCGTKCHVKEPSTEKDFSHKAIVEQFKNSAHGKSELFRYENGQPRCKYCHQNPIYQPMDEIMAKKVGTEKDTFDRCMGCHEKNEWTRRFLQHFVSRTKKRWNNREIVSMCNTCHANKELMDKFKLDNTAEFKETFHWRNVKYGTENGADCLRCHAPSKTGYSPHRILTASDPNSATHPGLRQKTCGQEGCHLSPTSFFVQGTLHSTGRKVQLIKSELVAMEDKLTPEEKEKLNEELKYQKTERLKNWIIWAIKLFYKIMIILVPGTMLIHQLLDLRMTIIEKSKGGH